jgi:spheroidene monooxygenase
MAPEPGVVVVVGLADIAAASRLWGYARFLGGRFALPRFPGLRFAKMLGSGHEGGFGLRPSGSRHGFLCVFDGDDEADRLLHSEFVRAYRARSRELLTVKLRAYSSRGEWSGHRIGLGASVPADGPIATLTRASIRWSRARAFWRKAPPAEQSLEQASGCLLAVGLGEAPVFRQATFSLWDSVESMDRYARGGAHLEAIRAAHSGGFFSESMFVRFVPYELRGVWKGRTFG